VPQPLSLDIAQFESTQIEVVEAHVAEQVQRGEVAHVLVHPMLPEVWGEDRE
jgi:hypothetical protein